MPIAIAIAGAAVIGAGASIISSNKAASTAKGVATQNNALQQNIYNQNAARLDPYGQRGNVAGDRINALLGLGGDTAAANTAFDAYKGSTEYSSRLKQGQDSVLAGLGARGLLDSGAAQKALLKYGQTFGSNEFGTYMGNLTGQQNTGLAAASSLAGVGQNYANAVTANNNNAANTQENAYLSNGQAINGVLSNALGAYGYSQGVGSSYKSPNAGVVGKAGVPGVGGNPFYMSAGGF